VTIPFHKVDKAHECETDPCHDRKEKKKKTT